MDNKLKVLFRKDFSVIILVWRCGGGFGIVGIINILFF